jgi:hypothetical protein
MPVMVEHGDAATLRGGPGKGGGCRWFVGGPPGAGKTYVGEALATRYGWAHFDCERFHRDSEPHTFQRFLSDPGPFLPARLPTVVTWGYIPSFAATVRCLIDHGYRPVWLHGSRLHLDAALQQRARQDPSSMAALSDDIWALVSEAKAVVDGWQHVDAFTPDGRRRDVAATIAAWVTT